MQYFSWWFYPLVSAVACLVIWLIRNVFGILFVKFTQFSCIWFVCFKMNYHIYLYIIPLTLWEPAYKYIIPGFQPKTSSFRLPYQHHSSSAKCARELFKVSNGSTSLLDCTKKNFLVGGCEFFVSNVVSEIVFGPFWLMLLCLGPNR